MKRLQLCLLFMCSTAFLTSQFSCQNKRKHSPKKEFNIDSTNKKSPYLIDASSIDLNSPHLKLIDVRKKKAFEKGHLSKALQLWRPDICRIGFDYSGMRLSKDSLAMLLQQLGVQQQDSLVLYDAKGNPDAARLWWLLQLYGCKQAFLLDKGLHAFDQIQWETGPPQTLPLGNFEFKHKNDTSLLATQKQVKQALYDSSTFLLDCRTKAEYEGSLLKKGAFRAGHIPGALHIDYSEAIAYENQYAFRDSNELALRFAEVPKKCKIIVYCQSGVRSALITFVLRELLHYPVVSNYDGSWIEWSYDKYLPIHFTELPDQKLVL